MVDMINSPSLDEFAKTNLFENVVTENRDLSVQSDFVSAGADDELLFFSCGAVSRRFTPSTQPGGSLAGNESRRSRSIFASILSSLPKPVGSSSLLLLLLTLGPHLSTSVWRTITSSASMCSGRLADATIFPEALFMLALLPRRRLQRADY